ncbi:MAG: hypothetical protein COC15_03205, partial [Legionellales bacterium]
MNENNDTNGDDSDYGTDLGSGDINSEETDVDYTNSDVSSDNEKNNKNSEKNDVKQQKKIEELTPNNSCESESNDDSEVESTLSAVLAELKQRYIIDNNSENEQQIIDALLSKNDIFSCNLKSIFDEIVKNSDGIAFYNLYCSIIECSVDTRLAIMSGDIKTYMHNYTIKVTTAARKELLSARIVNFTKYAHWKHERLVCSTLENQKENYKLENEKFYNTYDKLHGDLQVEKIKATNLSSKVRELIKKIDFQTEKSTNIIDNFKKNKISLYKLVKNINNQNRQTIKNFNTLKEAAGWFQRFELAHKELFSQENRQQYGNEISFGANHELVELQKRQGQAVYKKIAAVYKSKTEAQSAIEEYEASSAILEESNKQKRTHINKMQELIVKIEKNKIKLLEFTVNKNIIVKNKKPLRSNSKDNKNNKINIKRKVFKKRKQHEKRLNDISSYNFWKRIIKKKQSHNPLKFKNHNTTIDAIIKLFLKIELNLNNLQNQKNNSVKEWFKQLELEPIIVTEEQLQQCIIPKQVTQIRSLLQKQNSIVGAIVATLQLCEHKNKQIMPSKIVLPRPRNYSVSTVKSLHGLLAQCVIVSRDNKEKQEKLKLSQQDQRDYIIACVAYCKKVGEAIEKLMLKINKKITPLESKSDKIRVNNESRMLRKPQYNKIATGLSLAEQFKDV